MGKLNFTTAEINEILDRANVALDKENTTKEEIAAILFGIAGGLRIQDHNLNKGELQEYFENLFGNQDVLLDAYSNVCDDAKPWNAFWEFAKDKKTVADWTKLHAGGGSASGGGGLIKYVPIDGVLDDLPNVSTAVIQNYRMWTMDISDVLALGANHMVSFNLWCDCGGPTVTGGTAKLFTVLGDRVVEGYQGNNVYMYKGSVEGKKGLSLYRMIVYAVSDTEAEIYMIPYCNDHEIIDMNKKGNAMSLGIDQLLLAKEVILPEGYSHASPWGIGDSSASGSYFNHSVRLSCPGFAPFPKVNGYSRRHIKQYLCRCKGYTESTSNGGAKIVSPDMEYIEVDSNTTVQLFSPGATNQHTVWDMTIRAEEGGDEVYIYWIPVAP